jgi:hypothetical protein
MNQRNPAVVLLAALLAIAAGATACVVVALLAVEIFG